MATAVTVSSRPLLVRPRQRLYGRDTVQQQLYLALQKSIEGRPQFIMVGGPSGIGKTSLVETTCLFALKGQGYFVSGKFHQFNTVAPYGAWVRALEELLQHILAEPESRLQGWRQQIDRHLGSHANILLPLLPSLETLLKRSSAGRPLPSNDARHLIHESFIRLIEVFGQQKQTLAIFLDDLQWIDDASLRLFESISNSTGRLPIVLIGAYRDNELTGNSRLERLLRRHPGENAEMHHLALTPLTENDVIEWLAELTRQTPMDVGSLAQELIRRTQGNPLFLEQLLGTLLDHGWLCENADGLWSWNLAAIQQAGFAEHVVELMRQRFDQLPEPCQTVLAWAACIGGTFDLGLLSRLAQTSATDLLTTLQPALDQEYILPLDALNSSGKTRMRFVHDRIHEAAYAVLDSDRQQRTHYDITRQLQSERCATEPPERAIEIAQHANKARALFESANDELLLAQINLDAAQAAKKSAAFADAVQFMRQGMAALPDSIWTLNATLAFALFRLRSELEYLNSEFEAAEAFAREAITRETQVLNRVELYYMLVVQYTLRALYDQAVEMGREGLALLDEYLPLDELERVRQRELDAVRNYLGSQSLHSLADLPLATDDRRIALIRLLVALGPPTYRAFPTLWSVIVARATRLCLQWGLTPEAGYILPAYGGLLIYLEQGNGEDCRALYQATQSVMTHFKGTAQTSVAHLMQGSSLAPWFMPLSQGSEDFMRAYQTGRETGNLQYAVYGFGHDAYFRLFGGEPLDRLIQTLEGYLDYARQRGNQWGIDLMTGALLIAHMLHGEATPDTEEAAYLSRCEAHNNVQVLGTYYIMRACAQLLFQQPEAARKSLERAEALIECVSVQGLFPMAVFRILRALTLSWCNRLEDHELIIDQLAITLQQCNQWRTSASENFEHWYQLLLAEVARRNNDQKTTILAYEAGLAAAERQGCWPAARLITWRAAQYWRGERIEKFALTYEDQARLILGSAKAHGVLNAMSASQHNPPAAGVQIDELIQITQAFSQYTQLETLVPEVIHHVARQTGAERVALLLAQNKDLSLIVDSNIKETLQLTEPLPLGSVNNLPQSVIRYVARTQQMQRFEPEEIARTLLLRNDPYLADPDSPEHIFPSRGWCVPLAYLGEIVGVLYLERNAAQSGELWSSPTQTPLIEFLAAQVAISVRNIELIRRLADEGRARQKAELRIHRADLALQSQRNREDRLQKLAHTDALTELANRRLFNEALRTAWERAVNQPENNLTLMMLDIDHFKRINDDYGHAAGDAVLATFSRRIRSALRPADLAARLGGEEFAILLNVPQEVALALAERLRDLIARKPFMYENTPMYCTTSVGVAFYSEADGDHESLLRRADQALYRAKRAGRNCVRN